MGYEYDDYGPGEALCCRLYRPSRISPQVASILPVDTPSVNESGARRGCVVLAKHPDLIATLSSLPLLCCDDVSSAE